MSGAEAAATDKWSTRGYAAILYQLSRVQPPSSSSSSSSNGRGYSQEIALALSLASQIRFLRYDASSASVVTTSVLPQVKVYLNFALKMGRKEGGDGEVGRKCEQIIANAYAKVAELSFKRSSRSSFSEEDEENGCGLLKISCALLCEQMNERMKGWWGEGGEGEREGESEEGGWRRDVACVTRRLYQQYRCMCVSRQKSKNEPSLLSSLLHAVQWASVACFCSLSLSPSHQAAEGEGEREKCVSDLRALLRWLCKSFGKLILSLSSSLSLSLSF